MKKNDLGNDLILFIVLFIVGAIAIIFSASNDTKSEHEIERDNLDSAYNSDINLDNVLADFKEGVDYKLISKETLVDKPPYMEVSIYLEFENCNDSSDIVKIKVSASYQSTDTFIKLNNLSIGDTFKINWNEDKE